MTLNTLLNKFVSIFRANTFRDRNRIQTLNHEHLNAHIAKDIGLTNISSEHSIGTPEAPRKLLTTGLILTRAP